MTREPDPGTGGCRRRVLVTGCARAGTTYIAHVLTSLGLDTGHERMGRDGIASWCLAVDDESVPWGPPLGAASFGHVLHQVRHPLSTIASSQTMRPRSWEFICRHIPASMSEPLPLRCAKYWHYWNLHAERRAEWRYRVEDLGDVLEELCGRLGIVPDGTTLARTPGWINTRRAQYEPVTWAGLERLDRDLASRIRRQASRYGYAC